MNTDSVAIDSMANEIIRSIFEHAARIGREQQIDELVRLNADFARDLVGAERCSLWLIDPLKGELLTKVAHGVEPIRIQLGEGLIGACINNDEVLLVNDTSKESRLLREIDHHSGYHTKQVLCVPMRADGRVIGGLQLLNKPSGFTETDAGLLGLLAHFAASSIHSERLRQEAESAKVIKHELLLAHDVQSQLLPNPLASVAGIECVGFCRPARSVGGDYYDLLLRHDDAFVLTLGDVSGKGIPAAVMMASIQMLLRNLLLRDTRDLAGLVSELNHSLYVSSTDSRYSTLFCGVILADRTTLTYVNAGHVPPLLMHRDGRLERLSEASVPVGLLPQWKFEQHSVRLERGDTLLVVSDGIVEARNPEEDFWDESEIERILLEHISLPLAKLPEGLCRAVDEFAAGAEQYDDMTVVAVRLLA
jgi:sigma-B regulation protein RsbU (phosphoserine phosphatase)